MLVIHLSFGGFSMGLAAEEQVYRLQRMAARRERWQKLRRAPSSILKSDFCCGGLWMPVGIHGLRRGCSRVSAWIFSKEAATRENERPAAQVVLTSGHVDGQI